MSHALINRISIKKDGVYVSTKSSNVSAPYKSYKIDFLSKAYKKGGQEELDKALLSMFLDNCEARGTHKSVQPFKYLYNINSVHEAYMDMRKKQDKAYDELSDEDKKNIFIPFNKTERLKEYNDYCLDTQREFEEKVFCVFKNKYPERYV